MRIYNVYNDIHREGIKTKSPDGLNIVFVADIPTTGGATNSMIEIASALQDNYGAKCTVCTHQHSDLNIRLADKGIRSVVTGHGAFLAGGSKFKLKTAYSIVANCFRWRRAMSASIRVAEREIDLSKIDIIHSNLPRTDFGELLAAKYGIPHICHLRESSFEDFDCVSLRRNPGRFLSDNSAALIAVSDFVKQNWVARGVDPNKVEVIYNGVDTAGIERRSRQGVDLPLKVVFLGGYLKNKGIYDALEALAEMPQEYLSNVRLDVFGYGDSSSALRFIKKHGLSDIVSLNGPIDDVASRLADYDIGLACAKAEAFGRIVLEYQAAGLVVIAAERGGFPELIEDGLSGLLYNNSVVGRKLSEVLKRLIDCPHVFDGLVMREKPVRTPADVASDVYRLYVKILQ